MSPCQDISGRRSTGAFISHHRLSGRNDWLKRLKYPYLKLPCCASPQLGLYHQSQGIFYITYPAIYRNDDNNTYIIIQFSSLIAVMSRKEGDASFTSLLLYLLLLLPLLLLLLLLQLQLHLAISCPNALRTYVKIVPLEKSVLTAPAPHGVRTRHHKTALALQLALS